MTHRRLVALAGALLALGAAAPAQAAPAQAAPPDVTPIKVAASGLGDGHAVYVRGGDGRVWWRTVETFGAPGYSTRWRALPGRVGSGPDVAQVSDAELWLAARSTAGHLLVRRQQGAAFGAWQDLGGGLTSAPVLVNETGTPRLWAFARGAAGDARYRVRGGDGTWSPWRSIGGTLTAAPDAVDSLGQIRVYIRRGDGTTGVRAFDLTNRTWGPWQRVGLKVTSATSTVASSAVYQLQYFRGARNHVYVMVDVAPGDLGGVATSAPDATYGGEVVVVRGTDGALWARTDLAPWQRLGGHAT
ncbi:MAG TPA: hypothetical protein VGP02_17280 [Mycobacteriales bacterium]|nr:hypothetical protein [Mycobacteriales bacterium]